MKYDHTINTDGELTVTIKDTSADALLAELCRHMGCDAFNPSSNLISPALVNALEQIALEYIAEEKPQIDYWHKDECSDVNFMEVVVKCGRIHMKEQYDHDGANIRYNALYPEDFS